MTCFLNSSWSQLYFVKMNYFVKCLVRQFPLLQVIIYQYILIYLKKLVLIDEVVLDSL